MIYGTSENPIWSFRNHCSHIVTNIGVLLTLLNPTNASITGESLVNWPYKYLPISVTFSVGFRIRVPPSPCCHYHPLSLHLPLHIALLTVSLCVLYGVGSNDTKPPTVAGGIVTGTGGNRKNKQNSSENPVHVKEGDCLICGGFWDYWCC